MKRTIATLFLVCALGLYFSTGGLDAETKTATATVSATVPSVLTVQLVDDDDTAGQATAIIFDTIDSQDVSGGSDAFMYAPKRSTDKSWHYAKVKTTNASWSISVDLTSAPTNITKDKFKVGFSGGYRWDGTQSVAVSGLSADSSDSSYWKSFPNTRTTTDGVGEVKCYYNYQLDISNVPAGSYSGGVATFTVITS